MVLPNIRFNRQYIWNMTDVVNKGVKVYVRQKKHCEPLQQINYSNNPDSDTDASSCLDNLTFSSKPEGQKTYTLEDYFPLSLLLV